VIPPVPAIEATVAEIAPGESARIVVRASDAADHYSLWHNGQPESDAQDGTGGDLTFETKPVQNDSVFVMRIARSDAEGLKLVREARIAIRVQRGT
jgi:hypothetical protein